MTGKLRQNLRILAALTAAAFLAGSVPATAQSSTGDQPVKKRSMKHHVHKAAAPKVEYLRAAGSEPAAKPAK